MYIHTEICKLFVHIFIQFSIVLFFPLICVLFVFKILIVRDIENIFF